MVEYQKYRPEEVFVSYLGREATEKELWTGATNGILRYRRTGNEAFDLFVGLLHKTRKHQVSFYADEFGVDIKTLSYYVKMISGISCEEWILKYLFLCAADLLKHTDWPLEKIAEELDFATVKSFHHAFVTHSEGCPPARWRRIHGNKKSGR